MATKQQLSGEGFNSISSMSKSQLYDLMSLMKDLIDKNPPQAKQMLIDNPMLTRALFQGQILLGMVKPTQPSKVQQVLPQPQSSQAAQQSNVQATQSMPMQLDHPSQSQPMPSQPALSSRQQQLPQSQPSIPLPNASPPPLNIQSHRASQTKGPTNAPIPSLLTHQPSQIHNMPLPPPPAPPQYSNFQPHNMPNMTGQPQASLQIPGLFNQPMQPPPLPQQPRPAMQSFPHPTHSQMPHNIVFQQGGVPQQLQHLSQPIFHSGSNFGSSFPQGQPPLPSQPPPQHLYQGGPHLGQEYNQIRPNMQPERGSHWIPGLSERPTSGPHLPGPPPLGPPGQMVQGIGSTPPLRAPPLTPDMEKALLQQVMSLTPEQINLLPPEQRQQVIQLQEMLK